MADPAIDLEAFRKAARTWLSENFPESLTDSLRDLMMIHFTFC